MLPEEMNLPRLAAFSHRLSLSRLDAWRQPAAHLLAFVIAQVDIG